LFEYDADEERLYLAEEEEAEPEVELPGPANRAGTLD
jgi:hypothetical protein